MGFERTTLVGRTEYGPVYVTAKWDGRRLSLTGVEGKRSGDAAGGCGQITNTLTKLTRYAEGWDAARVAELATIWDKWHLNDMRAGCEHQRANWTNRHDKLEVISYKLTSAALQQRKAARTAAADAALKGVPLQITATARALAELVDWYSERFQPPDADSPLSGCYEVAKHETRLAGWVTPAEHPAGILGKPCEVCGYKYGTAWLHEDVPAAVVQWLEAMPDSGTDDWGRPLAGQEVKARPTLKP